MKFRIPEDILFREIEGEAVLLNIRTGVYFGLDKMGTAIWQRIQKKKRLEQVVDEMLQDFDVDRKTCEQDLREFTARLEKNNLLLIENG